MKKIVLIIIFVNFSTYSYAQFGFKLGVNFSGVTNTQYESKNGLHFGVAHRFGLSESIDLQL
jgi:hypothetical protein